MKIRGIDVSSYQGKPDWAEVKKSGIAFAVLRVLNSKGKDASFEHNYRGCETAGIKRGVYRFSYALTMAQAEREALEVVEVLAGRKLELGVWLDLEWKKQGALGASKVKEIAKTWMHVVQNAGYVCNIYCNMDWYQNLCKGLDAKYWIARYPADDDGSLNEKLRPNIGESGWQYSRKGRVSGIIGDVDLNIWYDSMEEAVAEPEEAIEWDTEAVKSLQEALNADGVRSAAGKTLKTDGIKGKQTDAAIEKILLKAGAFDASKGNYAVGSSGQVVKWLQMRLNTLIGNNLIAFLGKPLHPDGKLGTDTRLAIGLFQEIRNLRQDYIAGAMTVTELLKV